MPLSRLARELAAEIAQHDWSDAPFRADRAGHSRVHDTNAGPEQLTPAQTEIVRLNVIWVTGQVLAFSDPNFDIVEYAEAAGDLGTNPGWLKAGLRRVGKEYDVPGTWFTPTEHAENART